MNLNQIKFALVALLLLGAAAQSATAAVITVQQGVNGYSGCEGATVSSFWDTNTLSAITYSNFWGASAGAGSGSFVTPIRFNAQAISGKYSSVEKISLRLRVINNTLNEPLKVGLVFNNRGGNSGWQQTNMTVNICSIVGGVTNNWVGSGGNLYVLPDGYIPGSTYPSWDPADFIFNNWLTLGNNRRCDLSWVTVDSTTTNQYVTLDFCGLSAAEMKEMVDYWSFDYSGATLKPSYTNSVGPDLLYGAYSNVTVFNYASGIISNYNTGLVPPNAYTNIYTSNPGFHLVALSPNTNGAIQFASQWHTNLDWRPQLTIHYTDTNETTVSFQNSFLNDPNNPYTGAEGQALLGTSRSDGFQDYHWAASLASFGNLITVARFNGLNLTNQPAFTNPPARVILRLFNRGESTEISSLSGPGKLGVIFNNRGANSGWTFQQTTFKYLDGAGASVSWTGPAGYLAAIPYVPPVGAWDLDTNANNGLPLMGTVDVGPGTFGYQNIVFDNLNSAQLQKLLTIWGHDYAGGPLVNGGQTYTSNPGFFMALTDAGSITNGIIKFRSERDQYEARSHPVLIVTYPNSVAAAGPVTLAYQKIGANLVLTWPNGNLQSSTNVLGTYVDVPSASSPYTNNLSEPRRFFRVRVP